MQPGHNKRLRAALPQIERIIRPLATDTGHWHDTVWIADSTPVECGRSRPTVCRSRLAGWASHGHCRSHSRWFWGLRLYLIGAPAGLPIAWSLANPKLDEREVVAAMLDADPGLAAGRPGPLLIADRGFRARRFETDLRMRGITLLRPWMRGERSRPGEHLLKPVRQLIESAGDTLKGHSTWNGTVAAPSRASPSASPSASWP